MSHLKSFLLFLIAIGIFSILQPEIYRIQNKESNELNWTKKSPDITANCTVLQSGEIKCNFVNKGNLRGNLCVETIVRQDPSLTGGSRATFKSFNCSNIVLANDSKTILFPNTFKGSQYVKRYGFRWKDGGGGPCQINPHLKTTTNKIQAAKQDRWSYECDFEHIELPQ
jgi:hypothetical protein